MICSDCKKSHLILASNSPSEFRKRKNVPENTFLKSIVTSILLLIDLAVAVILLTWRRRKRFTTWIICCKYLIALKVLTSLERKQQRVKSFVRKKFITQNKRGVWSRYFFEDEPARQFYSFVRKLKIFIEKDTYIVGISHYNAMISAKFEVLKSYWEGMDQNELHVRKRYSTAARVKDSVDFFIHTLPLDRAITVGLSGKCFVSTGYCLFQKFIFSWIRKMYDCLDFYPQNQHVSLGENWRAVVVECDCRQWQWNYNQ